MSLVLLRSRSFFQEIRIEQYMSSALVQAAFEQQFQRHPSRLLAAPIPALALLPLRSQQPQGPPKNHLYLALPSEV